VNEYITWEFIKRAESEGFAKLELGPINPQLSRYKSKFDPVLEPLCFVERIDRLGKTVNFAQKMRSRAWKLVSGAIPRTHL
jgi:hypothetical protein